MSASPLPRSLDFSPAAGLLACHACDLLHHVRPLHRTRTALCSRCGGPLYRENPNSIDRALHLSLAAVVFFVLANVYPFMSFGLEGRIQTCTLTTGVFELWEAELQPLAVLVFLTTVALPLLELLGLLYVLIPLRLGFQVGHAGQVFRAVTWLGPWAMLEIYMLGVLVAFVKLSEMASIVLGIAFWSFCALIVVASAIGANLDARTVWNQIGVRR